MVAKALVNKPRLLILDEPTAGVDIELRRSLWDFLSEMNQQGVTMILTTHYLEEAERLCRNIAIIDKGDIVENTGMQELLAKLEKETFVLDLESPLEQVPALTNYDFRLEDPKKLIVTIKKGQELNEVFIELSKLNIRVVSMRNETGRLEELFVNLIDSDIDSEKSSNMDELK